MTNTFDLEWQSAQDLPIGADEMPRALQPGEHSRWERVCAEAEDYLRIRGRHCEVTLQKRPHYCDRGRVLANAHSMDGIALTIDYADGWEPGRYYFGLRTAFEEVEAWLLVRREYVFPTQDST